MRGITEQYLELNAQLHRDRPDYGAVGSRWAQQVDTFGRAIGAVTCVDVGCGKGSLKDKLRRFSPMQVVNYDPAVPEFAEPPQPADLTVCTDVLEHIEPAELYNFLEYLQELTLKGVFLNISCREAKKMLADGRNAHLIVRPPYFWFDTLKEYFDLESFHADPGQVTIIGRALGTLYRD